MWITALRNRRATRDATEEILDAILSLDGHLEDHNRRLEALERWVMSHDGHSRRHEEYGHHGPRTWGDG